MFFNFFLFKQKTAYEMRISDWSSDVCSSDLCDGETDRRAREQRRALAFEQLVPRHVEEDVEVAWRGAARAALTLARQADACAFADPRRDGDGQRLAPVDTALAAAGGAEIGRAHV